MVIVEGMDNTGKTTLAKLLHQELKFPLVASTGDQNLDYRHTQHLIHCRNVGGRGAAIIDRTPAISELVYGPLLRGRCRLPAPRKSLRELLETKPVLIYCRPSDDRILRFNDDIPQLEGVIDNAPALLQRYDALMESITSVIPIIQYDYVHMPLSEVIGKVCTLMQTRTTRAFDSLDETIGSLLYIPEKKENVG